MYLSHLFKTADHIPAIQMETTVGPAHPISFLWYHPTKIDFSGCVSVVDDTSDSFTLTVWQEITGIPPLTPLTICAVMSLKQGEQRPYQRLPEKNTVLHLGGDLLTIQNGIAWVAVHYHSYFACKTDDDFEFQFL